ncbi:hypothetical protein AM493_18255 [Flavobacterium akiainvivens]|uniref:Cation transporter n=1 Tax=Flavobacterium akiainvivens TaxID=1202724 RepID=A0A0M8MKM5_9FLAO|nr:hypothetical protein [Flavobacterium akiainvivens]KOS07777.1 hypothetical protein AM493_18255 [Flavobacterium akiainvivens]SFQ26105.1 hypothetical protein SAMN05444144_102232 [Flavobacterium akiainvivens]
MKLNKHISILLSALVLFANMGLALNVHYCHEKVTSVSFAYKVAEPANSHHHTHDEDEGKGCCKKVVDNHKKCCKDDVLKVKDTPEKAIVKSLQFDLGAFYTVETWKPSVFSGFDVVKVKKDTPSFYCESNAPPLYKLYCQYVLYA